MIETISMDHGALKETVTMDYGQPSTLGMVAARKAAIEGRSKENVRSSAPSDTLGFAKVSVAGSGCGWLTGVCPCGR